MTSKLVTLAATTAAAVALGVTGAVTSPAPPAAAGPETGPVFSTPGGDQIHRLVKRNIKGAPAGSTIRAAIAVSDPAIARALIRAHRRGVGVRLVIPIHATRGCGGADAADRLVRRLGTDQTGRSWVKCIRGSARNEPDRGGHMHMKVWAFSRTRGVDEVMVVTSQNATVSGRTDQWNDAFQGARWTALYQAWIGLFDELRRDNGGGFWQRSWGKIAAYATPVAPEHDPVLARLQGIRAKGARIRVAMSHLSYGRGRPVALARKLIRMHRRGADIELITTLSADHPEAPHAVKLLQRKVPVWTFRNDGPYLHSKVMTASFKVGRHREYRVWTGSEEWKDSSFNQDEFVLQLAGERFYKPYLSWWNTMRERAS